MSKDRLSQPLLRHIHEIVANESTIALPDAELLARFVTDREETAFTALVRRHGPMVLSLCRRALRHTQDAEDAFQATFLVLAQRAHAIRKRHALSSWLYGVALRIARKALTALKESPPRVRTDLDASDPAAEMTVAELQAGLDEELARLSEQYRAPLVLCYLEERTQDEAAQILGWSKGTLRRRLDKARAMLRVRLAQRGLALGTGLLASTFSAEASQVAIVSRLLPTTLETVNAFVSGRTKDVPAAVLALSLAGAGEGTWRKYTIGLLSLLIVGLLGPLGYLLLPSIPDELAAAEHVDATLQVPRLDHFGDPLPGGAVARLGTRRFRLLRGMNSQAGLAFAADGKTLATLEHTALAHVWDLATGKELRRFTSALRSADGRYWSNAAAALSSDGRLLAVAVHGEPGKELPSSYRCVRLYDVVGNRLLRESESATGS